VDEVTESAVLFVVRPWVKTADYWQTYWDLNREAMIRFARAGMRMGAPRDVRVEGRGPEPSPPR
jgi:small conductance mechanosensitive channel